MRRTSAGNVTTPLAMTDIVTVGVIVWRTGDHNYCRNTDASMTAPWCFTAVNRRELCAVHKCGEWATSRRLVLDRLHSKQLRWRTILNGVKPRLHRADRCEIELNSVKPCVYSECTAQFSLVQLLRCECSFSLFAPK